MTGPGRTKNSPSLTFAQDKRSPASSLATLMKANPHGGSSSYLEQATPRKSCLKNSQTRFPFDAHHSNSTKDLAGDTIDLDNSVINLAGGVTNGLVDTTIGQGSPGCLTGERNRVSTRPDQDRSSHHLAQGSSWDAHQREWVPAWQAGKSPFAYSNDGLKPGPNTSISIDRCGQKCIFFCRLLFTKHR